MRQYDPPILFATSNPHKVSEVRAVLAQIGVAIEGLDGLGREIAAPAEDQPTFAGNAALKARYYAQATGRVCLADDSGLEVDALGGAPGVHSARYAGVSGPRAVVDQANNERLLQGLAGVTEPERGARFVCSMVLWEGEGAVVAVEGVVEGRVLNEPRGDNGFGYDPLFWVDSLRCTTAELSSDAKNAISHRGIATRRLCEALADL
ncbi:MAG: non-canonical purine NTP pyrophosphatase, RdgB/HAM1 family [Planctomycetaceae bacterium]|nr:non-canonical purine NTP pyrophosphatase, RdgB/HAM1 family [Planctomycetaceae bacterium]